MDQFLKELARPRPDPGGGAAAAFGARLGLALLEKVVQLEGQRRTIPGGAGALTWPEALTRLRRLAEILGRLQAEDVRAYFNLTDAQASGDAARLVAAVHEAVACPRQIMAQAAEGLRLLAWVGEHCQKHLVSDLWVGGEFLAAALRGAYRIAGANLPLMADPELRQPLAGELDQAAGEGQDLYLQAQEALRVRGEGVDRRGG